MGEQVSIIQLSHLNPNTQSSVVHALRDVIVTEDVTPDKISVGMEIYDKLIPEMKNWKTDIVSVDTNQSSVNNELASLRTRYNWSDDFNQLIQAFSTITAADAQCQGRMVTDGVSYIEVHAVASVAGNDGQRHMQIIKARHDLKMAPQIETYTVQHTKPVYRMVNKRRNRFLGIIVDHWQESKFSHNEIINETKSVEKIPTLTGADFDNVKAFALNNLCSGIL